MRTPTSRIVAVVTELPTLTRSSEESEGRLAEVNGHLRFTPGLIRRLTGVESVHVSDDHEQVSDLAVAAGRRALASSPGDVDLLIFASASQDLVEPATSHIVSAKLGLTCPVMDVKNACNSVLNAMQVADALISAGQYRRILITSGEKPSLAVRWQLADQHQFARSFPGYTMSDGGAAVVVEAVGPNAAGSGIVDSHFEAASEHWQVGTLSIGGSMNPRDPEHSYFDMDGAALHRAFHHFGPEPVRRFLARNDLTPDDIDLMAIHQVALPYLSAAFETLGLPADRHIETIVDHGNLASVTLPLQLESAMSDGRGCTGALALLVGLAGGISLGLMLVRL